MLDEARVADMRRAEMQNMINRFELSLLILQLVHSGPISNV